MTKTHEGMNARNAKTVAEATHRYPTSIQYGDGWFGDGFRYLVAQTDRDALQYKGAVAAGCGHEHMQKRDNDQFRHLRTMEF